MNKQLIFCVETNKKANTDWIYIQELLKRMYGMPQDIKFTPIYMDSKQKYKSTSVKKQIKENILMYPGDSFVLMCIDTDNLNSNHIQKKEFDAIKTYCDENSYRLVWFNLNVEYVFLGHAVESKAKVKEAARFQRNKLINELDFSVLNKNRETQPGSNIYIILNSIIDES